MATPAPKTNLTGPEVPQPRKRARTPSPVAESSARDRLERPDLFPDPPPRTPTADSSFESSEEEQPLTPPADWTSAWDPRDSDGEGELQYVPQYDSDGDEARWQAREEREFSEERRAMSAERRTPVVYSLVSSVYSSYMPVSNPLPSPPRHSSSLPLFLAGFHSGSGDSSEESDAASETSRLRKIYELTADLFQGEAGSPVETRHPGRGFYGRYAIPTPPGSCKTPTPLARGFNRVLVDG